MTTMCQLSLLCAVLAATGAEPPLAGYSYQPPAPLAPAASAPVYFSPHAQTTNNYLPPRGGYESPHTSYAPAPAGSGPDYEHQGHYQQPAHQDHHDHHDNQVPKSYEFGYAVKDAASGNDYQRHEASDGSAVRGEYRVQLPDGRTQIVTYHADWKTGFHADVRYEGEARYPEQYNTHRPQGAYPEQHNTRQPQGGYNYNAPDYSGSLTGFHGNQQPAPAAAYGPPRHY